MEIDVEVVKFELIYVVNFNVIEDFECCVVEIIKFKCKMDGL